MLLKELRIAIHCAITGANHLFTRKTTKSAGLPRKSARTERAPIHRPPKAAAVGMYLFNSWTIDESRWPLITIFCSFNCLATYRNKDGSIIRRSRRIVQLTSLAELPETLIQVFEKKAQDPSIKDM